MNSDKTKAKRFCLYSRSFAFIRGPFSKTVFMPQMNANERK